MNKVTGRFFAPCRNVKRRNRHPVCRVSFCVFVWSLARRSSHRLCRPEAARRQKGWKDRQKTAWIPLRSGRFEMQEKLPRDRGKGLSPAPGQRVRTGGAGTAPPPIRSRCGSKNTGSCFRFVSSCSRVQRPGVHRHHRRWQGARPTRYRTDRGKSKKRQVSSRTAKR